MFGGLWRTMATAVRAAACTAAMAPRTTAFDATYMPSESPAPRSRRTMGNSSTISRTAVAAPSQVALTDRNMATVAA